MVEVFDLAEKLLSLAGVANMRAAALFLALYLVYKLISKCNRRWSSDLEHYRDSVRNCGIATIALLTGAAWIALPAIACHEKPALNLDIERFEDQSYIKVETDDHEIAVTLRMRVKNVGDFTAYDVTSGFDSSKPIDIGPGQSEYFQPTKEFSHKDKSSEAVAALAEEIKSGECPVEVNVSFTYQDSCGSIHSSRARYRVWSHRAILLERKLSRDSS